MKPLYCCEIKTSGKMYLRAALIIISVFIFSNRLSAFYDDGKVPVLVTCQWLEENISDTDLVILHISPVIRDYDNGHIPGARFLWPGWLTVSNEKESVVPAELEQMKKVLEGLGTSNMSHIVLCGIYGNIVAVCRVFVTLDHIGLGGRISILEGGFDEWKDSGRKVSVDQPMSVKGKLVLSVKDNLVNTDWVIQNLNNKAYCIIDVRSKAYYEGSAGTPRQGHIPGAKNLPYTDIFDSKTFHFVSVDKLKGMFAGLDIPKDVNPVFYCSGGSTACVGYLAAFMSGFNPIVYDGSMEAWGSRFDLPMEK